MLEFPHLVHLLFFLFHLPLLSSILEPNSLRISRQGKIKISLIICNDWWAFNLNWAQPKFSKFFVTLYLGHIN
jgi:hypothetical protein